MTPVHASPAPRSRRFARAVNRLSALKHFETPSTPGPALAGIAFRARFKRLTHYGWPRGFPIVQFPNAPLIAAFLAGQAASLGHGAVHADAAAVSYLAITVWAYEELVHGVNWFRHLLGFAYVISTAIHLAVALHR